MSIIKHTINILLKVLLIALFVFPLLWMVSTSLQSFEETMTVPPTFVPDVPQWINFVTAMNAGPFMIYARNSLIITVSVIVLQMIVMIPAAYAFARYNFWGKRLLFSLVLLAFMIPGQVTFIPVYFMLSDWGLINTLWPQILPFMANAFGIFLLRQYFMQIPDEIIEAARLDNTSELKIMWKIMLPMSKPVLSTVALFSFITHWNDYFWPLVMTNSADVRPLPIGISMLRDTEGISNWNIIMAGNMVLVIPIILVYLFSAKHILKAFVYSGIK